MVGDHGVGPAYQGFLREDCVTIGDVLGGSGYGTYYCGKWHASAGIPVTGEEPAAPVGSVRNPYPLSRGFDRFYGSMAGCGNYFNPHGLMEQDKQISADDDDYYYTDVISEKACGMIDEAVAEDKPFFLHVCYTAPHWPLHARPEDIEKYRGTYKKGWDYFRTARHEELKGQGVVDAQWDITPRDPDSRNFHDDSPKRQEWEQLRMAVYAAQVESMDTGIGRILETLRARGIEDNTMVMFLSDNGGCAEFLNEDGDGKSWPGYYRNTARPGETCSVGNIESMEPGPATTFMSYDLPWANVSNAPFRLYKHWVHEGGIATPFVIQWPKASGRGLINSRPCHIIDIMATCIEAAQASYPESHNGHEIPAYEGESFLPLLSSEEPSRQRPLFWEHEGNCAMRDGEWKLVKKYPGDWELHNMTEDRTELTDLSHKEKARKDGMVKQWEQWAARCGVLAWPTH